MDERQPDHSNSLDAVEPDSAASHEETLHAAERLRRRRRRRRFLAASLILAAVLAASVTLLLIGGAPPQTDIYTPPAEDIQPDDDPAQSDNGGGDGDDGNSRLNIRLEAESGQIVADISITGTVDDSNQFTEASGITGGQARRLTAGVCGYRNACPNGLPFHFDDDLGGLIDVTGLPILPEDDAVWFRARTACYQSPRSVADCNLELARGGYGLMQAAGMSSSCLADVYRQRVGYDSTVAPRWWNCGAAWWVPPSSDADERTTRKWSPCDAYAAFAFDSNDASTAVGRNTDAKCSDALDSDGIDLDLNVDDAAAVCQAAHRILSLVTDDAHQILSCGQWEQLPVNLEDLAGVIRMQEQSAN